MASIFENKRYQDLKVSDGVFVPDMENTFPEDHPYVHMFPIIKVKKINFDENYPYLDDSLWFKFHHWVCMTTVHTLLNIGMRLRWGLRVRGQEILKKYKKELSNGALTIANHCYRLDAVSVLIATRAWNTRIPVFGENMETKEHWTIWSVGGIPIPEGLAATKQFNAAFDEFHRRGWWIHIFPEECRWDFYKPIRPFRKGAFTMAYKYDLPIVPCCITFRERKGILKWFGKKGDPCITITLGEPIFPNKENNRKEEIDRLRTESRQCLIDMAGIENNTWPVAMDDEPTDPKD